MPRFVVNLQDKKNKKDNFILWSTIVDGCTRHFKNFEEASAYLKETLIPSEYEISINSLNTKGVSNPYYSINDLLNTNDEGCSTIEELIEAYCD